MHILTEVSPGKKTSMECDVDILTNTRSAMKLNPRHTSDASHSHDSYPDGGLPGKKLAWNATSIPDKRRSDALKTQKATPRRHPTSAKGEQTSHKGKTHTLYCRRLPVVFSGDCVNYKILMNRMTGRIRMSQRPVQLSLQDNSR